MAKPETESKVKYESEIVTRPITFESKLDLSQIPVFTIENCEVLNSSLTVATPKYGHNIQILLPENNILQATDRQIRNNYLLSAQEENPNLEIVKSALTVISKKDVLDGKAEEKNVGRAYLNFAISNACMLDETIDEEGNKKYKKINKAEEATGEAVVKYFRAIDQFTGEGIEPEVFKYDANGNKVTSFVNPKTKQESPLYIGRNDIVNIKIRPFGVKNQKTGDLSLRYNLLSVEIVQTAWDRGIGHTGGGKSNVKEAPDSVNASALSSIFGGISNVVPTTPASAPKKAEKKVEQPKAEEVPFDETPKAEATQTAEVPTIDFSALANLGAGVNLGE